MIEYNIYKQLVELQWKLKNLKTPTDQQRNALHLVNGWLCRSPHRSKAHFTVD